MSQVQLQSIKLLMVVHDLSTETVGLSAINLAAC